MKRALLFLIALVYSFTLSAQCDELFFSEYVEGYANNKALEIYNPTSEPINLSEYAILRFSNGNTTATDLYTTILPDVEIMPYDVYVVIVDLTDTTLWDSQFDKPVWNGYNLLDTIFDQVTGLPVTDSDGNVIIGPQYSENGAALFGNEYNERYDLQCKADVFMNPDYDTNRTMYFNGNDAMVLIKGTEVANDGSNILDVIGVIGEDPTSSIMEDAWVSEDGWWLTKNSTLVRKPEITSGRNAITDVVFAQGGTFTGEEWFDNFNNDFQYLQAHKSVCNPNDDMNWNLYSCSSGFASNTEEVNQVAFNFYPNPNTTGLLHIQGEKPVMSYSIMSQIGQIVQRGNFDFANELVDIDVSTLNSGMYFLSLQFESQEISTKVLVKE